MKSKPKFHYPDVVEDIADAKGFYLDDQPSLHKTGIPAKYAVRHSGSTPKGHCLYLCPYSKSCSSPPYSGDLATVGSHVCHYHLGHCILCPYDGLRFYNGDRWRKHMASAHSCAPWYRSQLPMVQHMPGPSTVSTTSTPAATVDTTGTANTTTFKVVTESVIPVSMPLIQKTSQRTHCPTWRIKMWMRIICRPRKMNPP